MNKFLKVGLILQIPNFLILIIVILATVINLINWNWIYYNIGFIILGTVIGLFNVFSLICLILGLLSKND